MEIGPLYLLLPTAIDFKTSFNLERNGTGIGIVYMTKIWVGHNSPKPARIKKFSLNRMRILVALSWTTRLLWKLLLRVLTDAPFGLALAFFLSTFFFNYVYLTERSIIFYVL